MVILLSNWVSVQLIIVHTILSDIESTIVFGFLFYSVFA